MTNDLKQRIVEHYLGRGFANSFTGKYRTFYLLYYETFKYIQNAISREKEIKGWVRNKKIELINKFNPRWEFLNKKIFGKWPPDIKLHRGNK